MTPSLKRSIRSRALGSTCASCAPLPTSHHRISSSSSPSPGARGDTSTLKGLRSAVRKASRGTTPCATASAVPTMCRIWCRTNATPEMRSTRYGWPSISSWRWTRQHSTDRNTCALRLALYGSRARGQLSSAAWYTWPSPRRRPDAKLWNLCVPCAAQFGVGG
eukprot:7384327-Prymnesium_polylepis.2